MIVSSICDFATSKSKLTSSFIFFSCYLLLVNISYAEEVDWSKAWPQTDFSKRNVEMSEIISGGPGRDGIPPIDNPKFIPISQNTEVLLSEPVISVIINGEEKAYPLRILMWHEIVNDTVGNIPVAVTYCPLCNAAIVFDRRVKDHLLTFGTTGNLRNSDLVMWDRQTESWWQQFSGIAIIGELTNTELDIIPSRLESLAKFQERAGIKAKILVPNDRKLRQYGVNPYTRYDGGYPFLYKGDLPKDIKPLTRVISLKDKKEAWSINLLRKLRKLELPDGTIIEWSEGQNSALDTNWIANGKDVGNIVVTRNGEDQIYFVDFAFAFYAFHPDAPIHK
ncbi:MAG: DUF3179 domain-containing protein [Alphaproteobacteria bacterium]|nr:DUF3179 domain-containing protein [Alphaproteobacteria bacterium]